MDSLWQHIVIAVMVIVAAAYLSYRWYRIRQRRGENPCGSCKCQLKQVHDITARTEPPSQAVGHDAEEDSDSRS
jgi:hypothetical protein